MHNIKFHGEQPSADADPIENYKLELARFSNEGLNMPDQMFDADEISNALVDENMENEWMPNANLYDVKKGLSLSKQLELHFTQADRSMVRRAKFKKEFKRCLAPYREILVYL